MSNHYYVIVEGSGHPWVLGLQPYDKAGAERAIRWQRKCGNEEPMHPCLYDRIRRAFVNTAGRDFMPEQGSYTDDAWNRFMSSLQGVSFWESALTEARKLSDGDLARHASVSTDNGHSCEDCFTCACEAVRQERQRDKSA